MATEGHSTEEVESPDVHFEPLVQLPAVEVITMEEDEEELIQMRAKLFRFDNSDEPPQWKERGTGVVKLLRHKTTNLVRVLMRRDKTHKLCANHYVQPEMELKPNCGSDKAWVWTTQADFSDDEPKTELLAIRFANAENAQKWKAKFTEAQQIMKEAIPVYNKKIGKKESTPNGTETVKTTETSGDGDKSPSTGTENTKNDSEVGAKSPNKDTETVVEKLESLTVKENVSEKDSNPEASGTNKTDDDKAKD